MARKSIPETVSSVAVQEEIKRPFRAGLYARISMETGEKIEGWKTTMIRLLTGSYLKSEQATSEKSRGVAETRTNYTLARCRKQPALILSIEGWWSDVSQWEGISLSLSIC